MREARRIMIGVRIAPNVPVLTRTSGTSENTYILECGHIALSAPHFSLSKNETMKCHECGYDSVPTDPEYAHEFNEIK